MTKVCLPQSGGGGGDINGNIKTMLYNYQELELDGNDL